MSHVITLKMENVQDLDALSTAAEEVGMELVTGIKQYKWWGHSVGDYPIPQGFRASDLGKCDHVLRVKDNPNAYEIGVVQAKNGKPGYQLIYDFYGTQGAPLKKAVGANGEHLEASYIKNRTINMHRKNGYRVSTTEKDGRVFVRAVR